MGLILYLFAERGVSDSVSGKSYVAKSVQEVWMLDKSCKLR